MSAPPENSPNLAMRQNHLDQCCRLEKKQTRSTKTSNIKSAFAELSRASGILVASGSFTWALVCRSGTHKKGARAFLGKAANSPRLQLERQPAMPRRRGWVCERSWPLFGIPAYLDEKTYAFRGQCSSPVQYSNRDSDLIWGRVKPARARSGVKRN